MIKYTNEELTNNIIKILKDKLKKDYDKGSFKRDAHAKCIGLLKAKFVVDDNIPKKYQVGIFEPKKEYPALIRISNSNPKILSDKFKDFRGFSIKLLGVEGEKCMNDEKYTQDFLLVNNEIMPIGTWKLFHDAIYYTNKSMPFIFVFKLLMQHKMGVVIRSLRNMKNDTSPLDIKYFSTTPYKFGDEVVKYCIVPKSKYKSKLPKKLTHRYLTKNMQVHLNNFEAVFDFMVQFRTDKVNMPINDASIKWDENKSPFIKLGEIRIPKQKFETKQRFELSEVMSFSPGHSLLTHQPIGDINEGRMKIYKEMSKFRNKMNNKDIFEPNKEYFNKIK